MQKIYYSKHLYQYKKIPWSRFAFGENRHNWWDCSCLTKFLCSMTFEVQFPWFLKQLILDNTFFYLISYICWWWSFTDLAGLISAEAACLKTKSTVGREIQNNDSPQGPPGRQFVFWFTNVEDWAEQEQGKGS